MGLQHLFETGHATINVVYFHCHLTNFGPVLRFFDSFQNQFFGSLDVDLEQINLVRLERTGDGLLKVFPGKNAKHYRADHPTGGDLT